MSPRRDHSVAGLETFTVELRPVTVGLTELLLAGLAVAVVICVVLAIVHVRRRRR